MLKRKPRQSQYLENMFYRVALKNNIIPIADDYSGDRYILMDMSATESKVYYIDTELHDEDLMLIDKSFKKFINSFKLSEKQESEFKVYNDLILEGKYDELKNKIESLSKEELEKTIRNLAGFDNKLIEEIKKVLLSRGKEVSENNSTTKIDLLKLLLENGADPKVIDFQKKNVFDWVEKYAVDFSE